MMRSTATGKAGGAKIALRYDAMEDYRRKLEEEPCDKKPDNAQRCSFGYVVAIGEALDGGAYYAGADGEPTAFIEHAKLFDAWEDAVRFVIDTYEIPRFVGSVPRGFEFPKYPRVCYLRLWAEIVEC